LYWVASHVDGLINFSVKIALLNTGITHQPIWCHHLSWHSDAHIAVSFLGIPVAGATLGTWCSAIIVVVTLI